MRSTRLFLAFLFAALLLTGCGNGQTVSSPTSSEYIFSHMTASSETISLTSTESVYSMPQLVFSKKVTSRIFEDTLYSSSPVLIGEIDGMLLIQSGNIRLFLLNPDTLEIEKQVDLDDADFYHVNYAKLVGDQIIVKLTDRLVFLNFNLQIKKEQKLPQVLLDAFKLVKPGTNGTMSYGYDVSSDLTMYCYNDYEGLKLYDSKTGKSRLLASPVTVDLPDEEKVQSYYRFPQFVNDDKQIISNVYGYEGLEFCCRTDVKTGESTHIPSDAGVLRPAQNGICLLRGNQQDNMCDVVYYNTRENTTQATGFLVPDIGEMRSSDQSYTGKSYCTILTYEENANNPSIHRINLSTLEVEEHYLSVQGGSVAIVGVTESGRILMNYGRMFYITQD